MNGDIITSVSATMGGGFFGGLLVGYALKKVVKVVAVVVGLFIAGLAYLQYQQVVSFAKAFKKRDNIISCHLSKMFVAGMP